MKGKKDEYREIKAEYNVIRQEMIKEAKIAKSFKFTKMTKKIPFLPALHPLDEGFQKQNSINIGDTYLDGRDRNK